MLILIVMTTIIFVGLAAIAFAEPHLENHVWSDDLERRILREGRFRNTWW